VLFTVAGFVTTPANNGTYVCVASTTSTLTLANSGGFAEAHPATASGTQNSAVYTGTYTGGASNAFAGLIFTVTGFTNAANNGVFYASASTATTLTLSNANAVAEVASAVLYTGLPESIIAKISG
jgi:arabinogalactan endo-1,4-beta-galactosidase